MSERGETRRFRWWWGEGEPQRDVMVYVYMPDDAGTEALEDLNGFVEINSQVHSVNFMSEILRELGERHGLAMEWRMEGEETWHVTYARTPNPYPQGD